MKDTIWIPPENQDHKILIKNGEFHSVIKGRKSLRLILEEHRDAKDLIDPTKDRLTAAQRTKFNTIHKVNTR